MASNVNSVVLVPAHTVFPTENTTSSLQHLHPVAIEPPQDTFQNAIRNTQDFLHQGARREANWHDAYIFGPVADLSSHAYKALGDGFHGAADGLRGLNRHVPVTGLADGLTHVGHSLHALSQDRPTLKTLVAIPWTIGETIGSLAAGPLGAALSLTRLASHFTPPAAPLAHTPGPLDPLKHLEAGAEHQAALGALNAAGEAELAASKQPITSALERAGKSIQNTAGKVLKTFEEAAPKVIR